MFRNPSQIIETSFLKVFTMIILRWNVTGVGRESFTYQVTEYMYHPIRLGKLDKTTFTYHPDTLSYEN